MKAPDVGEISNAFRLGYRVTVHDKFFPYDALDNMGETKTIHAQVDHGAQAIFCSQAWYDALPKVPA